MNGCGCDLCSSIGVADAQSNMTPSQVKVIVKILQSKEFSLKENNLKNSFANYSVYGSG